MLFTPVNVNAPARNPPVPTSEETIPSDSHTNAMAATVVSNATVKEESSEASDTKSALPVPPLPPSPTRTSSPAIPNTTRYRRPQREGKPLHFKCSRCTFREVTPGDVRAHIHRSQRPHDMTTDYVVYLGPPGGEPRGWIADKPVVEFAAYKNRVQGQR